MMASLEESFKQAMLHTYHEASTLGYRPTYFLRMVGERGGVVAAKELIHNPEFSYGFTRLWELGRLDLSVESLVLESQWQGLFDNADRKAARDDKLLKVDLRTGAKCAVAATYATVEHSGHQAEQKFIKGDTMPTCPTCQTKTSWAIKQ